MIKINHTLAELSHPYSPGAFYHAVKKLSDSSMIKINHDLVEITPIGQAHLTETLLTSRLPSSFLGISYYILALQLIRHPETKKNGLHRIEIELIKSKHTSKNQPDSRTESSTEEEALTPWRNELSSTLRRIILNLSA